MAWSGRRKYLPCRTARACLPSTETKVFPSAFRLIFLAGLLGLASHLPPGRGGRGREVDAEVQNLYAHQIVDTSWLRYEDYRKWAFDYEIEARAKTDANFLPVTSAVHELSGWAFFMDSDRAPTRMPGLFRKAYNKALKDVAARDELGTGEPCLRARPRPWRPAGMIPAPAEAGRSIRNAVSDDGTTMKSDRGYAAPSKRAGRTRLCRIGRITSGVIRKFPAYPVVT